MSALALRSLTAGPRIDHPLTLASGVGRRTLHTGVIELSPTSVEGPARREAVVSAFVPDALSYDADVEARGGVAVALVCVQAIVPVSTTDARVNVLAARARFAPDAQGHTRVALDLSVEALYVTSRNTLRFAYQVEVVAPTSR